MYLAACRSNGLGGACEGKSDLGGKHCGAHIHTLQQSNFSVASGLCSLSGPCLLTQKSPKVTHPKQLLKSGLCCNVWPVAYCGIAKGPKLEDRLSFPLVVVC